MNNLYALIFLVSLLSALICLFFLPFKSYRKSAARRLGLAVFAAFISVVLIAESGQDSKDKFKATTDDQQKPNELKSADNDVRSALSNTQELTDPPGKPGMARLCLDDNFEGLPKGAVVELPATTILQDSGALKGEIDKPETWSYEAREGKFDNPQIITLAKANFSAKQRCSDVAVNIFIENGKNAVKPKAEDRHLFDISDLLDYEIPDKAPAVEVGKLFDDIAIHAILIDNPTDITRKASDPDDKAANASTCLQQAKKFAAHIGGGIGRQGDLVIKIGGLAASEASFGCAKFSFQPDVFIAWNGSARPKSDIRNLVSKAGAYIAGLSQAEVSRQADLCIAEALKPKSQEMAELHYKGARIECSAFTRDGGAGSITIYRRYGKAIFADVSTEQIAAMEKASEAVKVKEEKDRADSLAFAAWYEDKSVPEITRKAIISIGLLRGLELHCGKIKLKRSAIERYLAFGGLTFEDIDDGGSYQNIVKQMSYLESAAVMMKTSEDDACEQLKAIR